MSKMPWLQAIVCCVGLEDYFTLSYLCRMTRTRAYQRRMLRFAFDSMQQLSGGTGDVLHIVIICGTTFTQGA